MKTPRTAASELSSISLTPRERLARAGAFTALLQSVVTLMLLPMIARQRGRRACVAAAWGWGEGAGRVLRLSGPGGENQPEP